MLGKKKNHLFKVAMLVLAGALVLAPLSAYALFGWVQDWAVEEINKSWPPQTGGDRRRVAIGVSATGLESMQAPSLSFIVAKEELVPIVIASIAAASANQPFEISNLSLTLSEQEILFDVQFRGRWEEQGVSGSGQIQGAVSVAIDGPELVLSPSLSRLQIATLDVDGWWWLPSRLAAFVNPLLQTFVANVNGQIEPGRVTVLSRESGTPTRIEIGTKSISVPPISVRSTSMLITSSHVVALFELGGSSAAQTDGERSVPEFQEFKAEFLRKAGALAANPLKSGLRLNEQFVATVFKELTVFATREERRQQALDRTAQALKELRGPDVLLFVPAPTLQQELEMTLKSGLEKLAERNEVSVENTAVALKEGEVLATADVSVALPNPLKGRIAVRLSVAVAPYLEPSRVMFLPSIVELAIAKIDVKSTELDITTLVTAVNAVLSVLTTGITEAFPAVPISIDEYRIPGVKLGEAAKDVAGLTLEPSHLPGLRLQMGMGAVRLGTDGLEVLLDIETPLVPARPAVAGRSNVIGDSALFNTFAEIRSARFGALELDSITGALSWERLATVWNATWSIAGGVRARYAFDTGTQPMESTQIELVERPNYSCKRDRKCSFNSCANNCKRKDCSYSCPSAGADVPCPTWREPTRFCYKSVEEPGCVAGREICKVEREAKYGACQLACNAEANLKKAECDGLAEMEVLGCNAGREFQRFAAEVGGIGRIGGEVRASGIVVTDTQALVLTKESLGVRFAPRLTGGLDVNGALEFTPYDIGHLLVCPAKGKAPFRIHVDVPTQQPTISAALTVVPEEKGDGNEKSLDLRLEVNSFVLKAKLSPPPAEAILRENPHLFVVCNPVLPGGIASLSILGQAKGLRGDDLVRSVAGKEVSAAFTGDLEFKLDAFDVPLQIPPLSIKMLDQKPHSMRARLTEKAVWFSDSR